MERMRNLRGMRGMGRNFMMPGMGIGSLARMPSKDVNDLPLPDRTSDIMPRDGMMPKQPPQLGMATQMAGVPPRGSGLPPMPNPMMDMQGRRFMAKGGEVDPNPGITALRKVAPEAVEAMGYSMGGDVNMSDVYSRLSKALGGLSKDEFTLMKELYYNGNSSGDIIKKVTDFRSGAFVPKKFEDVDTKINRLSKDLGTGETSRDMSKGKPNMMSKQQSMPERLKNLLPDQKDLQKGLRSLRTLPKFSLPSAAAGFGAGFLLDNLFDDSPDTETTTYTMDEMDDMKARYSPQEIDMSPLIDMNASGDFSDELPNTPGIDINPPMQPMEPMPVIDRNPSEESLLSSSRANYARAEEKLYNMTGYRPPIEDKILLENYYGPSNALLISPRNVEEMAEYVREEQKRARNLITLD